MMTSFEMNALVVCFLLALISVCIYAMYHLFNGGGIGVAVLEHLVRQYYDSRFRDVSCKKVAQEVLFPFFETNFANITSPADIFYAYADGIMYVQLPALTKVGAPIDDVTRTRLESHLWSALPQCLQALDSIAVRSSVVLTETEIQISIASIYFEARQRRLDPPKKQQKDVPLSVMMGRNKNERK